MTTETDPFGNTRHVLTVNSQHHRLEVVSSASVEVDRPPGLPENSAPGAWEEVRSMSSDPRWWDFTGASPVARPSRALDEFVTELGVTPAADPLVDVLALSSALTDAFEYTPGATSVDSPIEDILTSRKGVCQDYAHVLVAIARSWGLPTRYVSGYLLRHRDRTRCRGIRLRNSDARLGRDAAARPGLGGSRPHQPHGRRPAVRAHSGRS